jgi:hypothetical protein
MADLKSLLGDKYKEGMTIEEIMGLEVEEPKADTSAYDNLKKRFDEVASEAANYKKQLRASMSEADAKAAADAEKYANMEAELEQLKADKAIAENAKGLVAIGYDETLANEVATALYNGDAKAVIQAQAKFVDAQKKAVLADAVKETPVPPAGGEGGNVVTKEKLRAMSPAERYEFSQKNPEEYKKIYNGG